MQTELVVVEKVSPFKKFQQWHIQKMN